MHTDTFYYDLVDSNQIWIVITPFRKIYTKLNSVWCRIYLNTLKLFRVIMYNLEKSYHTYIS